MEWKKNCCLLQMQVHLFCYLFCFSFAIATLCVTMCSPDMLLNCVFAAAISLALSVSLYVFLAQPANFHFIFLFCCTTSSATVHMYWCLFSFACIWRSTARARERFVPDNDDNYSRVVMAVDWLFTTAEDICFSFSFSSLTVHFRTSFFLFFGNRNAQNATFLLEKRTFYWLHFYMLVYMQSLDLLKKKQQKMYQFANSAQHK